MEVEKKENFLILEQRKYDSRQPITGKPANAFASLNGLMAYCFLPLRNLSDSEQYQCVSWPNTALCRSSASDRAFSNCSRSWSRRGFSLINSSSMSFFPSMSACFKASSASAQKRSSSAYCESILESCRQERIHSFYFYAFPLGPRLRGAPQESFARFIVILARHGLENSLNVVDCGVSCLSNFQ